MRLACMSILLLAGCPPKSPNGPSAGGGAGCPTAKNVYVASYLTQDAGKGRTGWVLPLQALKVDPGASTPEYAELDPAAASASGVPAAPTGTLWLVTAAGTPCRASAGKYYAAKVDGPPAGLTYGVELEGCAAPTDPQDAGGIVLVGDAAPTGCRFEGPQPIAARLGTMTEDGKRWQPPASEATMPRELAAAIPAHECAAPACQMLWAVNAIQPHAGMMAWSVAVNWLAVGDPAAPCSWQAERFSGVFIPAPGGGVRRLDEGFEHPLVLSAELVDDGGAKVLLAEGPGEYATYDIVPQHEGLGNHITWMFAPHEAYEAVDHLGPICESAAAKPAPLPRDAKPVSPYP
jgi:hypothetical protein